MTTRNGQYFKFKKLTGLTSFDGKQYPQGSTQFWTDAIAVAKEAKKEKIDLKTLGNPTVVERVRNPNLNADLSNDLEKGFDELLNRKANKFTVIGYTKNLEQFHQVLEKRYNALKNAYNKTLIDGLNSTPSGHIIYQTKNSSSDNPEYRTVNQKILNKLHNEIRLVDVVRKLNPGLTIYEFKQKKADGDFEKELKELVKEKIVILGTDDQTGGTESDPDMSDLVDNSTVMFITFEFVSLNQGKSNKLREGAFFPYLVNEEIYLDSWKRYGLYKEIDTMEHAQNCLFVAIKEHNLLNEEELQSVASCFRSTHIPQKSIKELCDRLNIYIKIYDVNNAKYIHHNKMGLRVFEIGLVEDHYFIMDKNTKCTLYYLKNYKDIKKYSNPNEITRLNFDKRDNKTRVERGKDKNITSSILFINLLKMKEDYLTRINKDTLNLCYTPYYNNSDDSENLDYSELDAKPVELHRENTESKNPKTIVTIYFDTETYINSYGNQTPYMIVARSIIDNETDKQFYYSGNLCVDNFFASLVSSYSDSKYDVTLFAHNLGFDIRMLLRHQYSKLLKVIERGNSMIKAEMLLFSGYDKEGKKNKLKITLKDSYAFIPEPLRAFPKMFGLKDTQKEAICYEWYNKNTMCYEENGDLKPFVMSKEEAIKEAFKSQQFIDQEEREEFNKNFNNTVDKWELDKEDLNGVKHPIDMIAYAKKYCVMDVEILAKGFETFRKWMLDITGIDVVKGACTISSLADKFAIKFGCYDGVYCFANKVREFIQKAVVGGRVMIANNEPHRVKVKMQDFDGVSLYPSAMAESDGALLGKPKVIQPEQLNEEFLEKQDGFYIEVEALSIGIKRDFPLLSYKDDNSGIRDFTNDIVGKKFVLSKVQYIDAKQYQDIKFRIIRGYYFNEGHNTKIKEFARFLFNERCQKKKEGNQIQAAYKLLMNSAYGKCIEKEHNQNRTFVNSIEERDKFIIRNHNHIESLYDIGNGKWVIRTNVAINIHYSRPHVGVDILAMSKRIMNRVMCTAEDIGLKLHYTDTDSIHMKEADIKPLEDEYFTRFNKVLVGSDLGQFHCDFSMGEDKGTTPYAVESIFLGKKCYMDVIEYVKDGKITRGNHIRLKGVCSKAIIKHEKYTVEEIYNKLFNGDIIRFDLKRAGKIMKYNRDYNISSNAEFYRYVTFNKTTRETHKAQVKANKN